MNTMIDVEVVDIRKINSDSKLRAYADVKVAGSLVLRGFSVLKGDNGIFVSLPAKAGKDGKWYETVIPTDEKLGRYMKDKVMEAYDRETDGVRG